MNFNDPNERLAFIENNGVEAYNKAVEEHTRKSTVTTVCGHDIILISTKFGKMCQVSVKCRRLDELF